MAKKKEMVSEPTGLDILHGITQVISSCLHLQDIVQRTIETAAQASLTNPLDNTLLIPLDTLKNHTLTTLKNPIDFL